MICEFYSNRLLIASMFVTLKLLPLLPFNSFLVCSDISLICIEHSPMVYFSLLILIIDSSLFPYNVTTDQLILYDTIFYTLECIYQNKESLIHCFLNTTNQLNQDILDYLFEYSVYQSTNKWSLVLSANSNDKIGLCFYTEW